MDYVADEPIFKTATARKEYVVAVTKDFEEANTHAELMILYQHHQDRLERMLKSDNEHDLLAADIIHGRYKMFHERIDASREWVHQILREHEESFNKL